MPRVGQTDPWPHQPHRLTGAELVAVAGAGNGAHWQFQTQQVMNQLQGPPEGSWQQQEQTGLEHRSKGSFQLDYLLQVVQGPSAGRGGARHGYSTAQTRTSSTGLTQNGPTAGGGWEPRQGSSGRLRVLIALRPLTILWFSWPLACLPLLLLILENLALSLKCDRKSRSEELKAAVLFQVTRDIFSFLHMTQSWRILHSAEVFEYL